MPPEVVAILGMVCFGAGVVLGVAGKIPLGIFFVGVGIAFVFGGSFLK
jgi:hypothetical protein